MLGKRINLVTGKIIGTSVSNTGPRLVDIDSSPRSHFELKTQSRIGFKNYDFGGVGLGIVLAMEKSGHFCQEINANKTSDNMNPNRSKPIPVHSCHNSKIIRGGSVEEMEMESLEEYSLVTCGGPVNKFYRDWGDNDRNIGKRSIKSTNNQTAIIFYISTPKGDFTAAYPALSCCHLCHKKLHGEDIYMYRGEKGFCSSDCRSIQILVDERKENCGSEDAPRTVDTVPSYHVFPNNVCYLD